MFSSTKSFSFSVFSDPNEPQNKKLFLEKRKVGDEAAAPNNVQRKHTSVFLEGN